MQKILLFILVIPALSFGQRKHTVSGYVRDALNGEELIGVNIVIPELKAGTSTNSYGYYAINAGDGTFEISFQYIGYQTITRTIDISENVVLDIEMQELTTELQAVDINSERLDKNVTSVEMSVTKLDAKDIQKIPQLLGETDIIRTLTLLPGITTVGEGANGFNVRGGNTDQNLILLDEAPVYNSSHLFGFFSIFNADAVKDVKLYKGGIPAEYGGRLSSVVDVRQKEGNSKKFGFNGGIGLLSSRVLVEGPIVKEKSSFMIAARRSYADIFLGLSSDPDINQNIIYFYDLNAKINYRLGKKDRLFLSGYFGRDVFGIENLFGFDWGNATSSLRWNHLFSDKLFSNFTLIYSDYTYSLGTPEDDDVAFRLTSTIEDYHAKGSFNYYFNTNNRLDFGFEGIYYRFSPGDFSGFRDIKLQQEFAIEPSIYVSHEMKMGQRLTLQYGIRYSSFYNVGGRDVTQYEDPGRPERNEDVGVRSYDNLELIAAYEGLDGLEPRISVNYLINDVSSVKASYNRTRQYIHLISNTTSPTPVDLYRPAGSYIEPATVHQLAGGYFINLFDNKLEISAETFYKDFFNIVDYRAGAELIFNETIETELLTGIGRSYGLELLLRKQSGKLTGWLSYTLSRSELKVESSDPDLAISNGEWYSANYDKLHDISVVANYQLTKKWDIGATFIFQTGRPITPPSGKFEFEDITVPIYEDRNSIRIPNYHRLDLSANYTPERVKGKRFYSSWSVGIYNVYARRNAYSIFFQPSNLASDAPVTASPFTTEAIRLSIFATAIPFVTWNFNF